MDFRFLVGAIAFLGIGAAQAAPGPISPSGPEQSPYLQNIRGEVVHVEDEDGDGEPEELICRRVRVTGSIRIQRYCFTRAEWTEMREDNIRDMAENEGVNAVTLDPLEGSNRTIGSQIGTER